MAGNFDAQLAVGQAGESVIARWLRERGNAVVPVYEKVLDTGKGPRLFLPGSTTIAPDLLVFKSADACWIEAKTKSIFSWWDIGQVWETGIDLRHWEAYQEVAEKTPWPVWLLFWQLGRDAPGRDGIVSATAAGLFGNTLAYLAAHVSHIWPGSARQSPMVYWAQKDLRRMASEDEMLALASEESRQGSLSLR